MTIGAPDGQTLDGKTYTFGYVVRRRAGDASHVAARPEGDLHREVQGEHG